MISLPPEDEMPEPAPRRLIEGGAGEHERSLVASARLDRVPSAAKARVAAALGGVLAEGPAVMHAEGSGASAGGAPESSLHRLGTRSAFRVLGGGLVGAAALSIWLNGTPRGDRAAPDAPASLAPSPAISARSAAPPETSASEPSAAPPAAPARSDLGKARGAVARAVTGHAVPDAAGLLAEVRALEAVQSALAARRIDRAARDLDAYRRRFPRGELAIEADVLAIELALARGQREAARHAADKLLARSEAQHYRSRVRALLERHERSGARAGEDSSSGRSDAASAHMRARR